MAGLNPERCHRILRIAWELAVERGGCHTRRYHLPAGQLELKTSGFAPELLGSALHPTSKRPSESSHLTARLFAQPRQVGPPPPPWSPSEPPGGDFVGLRRPAINAWMHRSANNIVASCEPTGLLPSDRAKPLHSLLMRWHSDQGISVLHGTMISERDRGVLLMGPENSGKSTVALCCLERGFQLVGDDHIALDHDKGAGFYRSLWLEAEHSKRFGHWFKEAFSDPREAKSCIILDPRMTKPWTRIQAIIYPQLGHRSRLLRTSATASECLPSEIARFRLELGDTDEVASLVRRALSLSS